MSAFKQLLKFTSLSVVVTPVGTTMSEVGETKTQQNTEYANLFNSIKNNSKPIDEIQKWTFEGQDFYDEDQLNKYLIDRGEIKQVQTTSNPNKIIKDIGNGILDSSKIYDLDQSNFQQVYRDAFGNVALDRQSALNTYVNNGLVEHKYSYDNNTWFDSPEEAKNDYVYQGGLHKSLYYYINGKYYNLFNKKDETSLKKVLKEGYRVSASRMTNNQVVYGTKDRVESTIRNSLRKPWTAGKNSAPKGELHYSNFLNKSVEKSIKVTPSSDILLKVHYTDGSEKHYDQKSATLIFNDNNISDTYLLNSSNWEWVMDWFNHPGWGEDFLRKMYYFKHSGVDTSNNNKNFSEIEFYPKSSKVGSGFVDLNFNQQSAEVSYKTTVTLFLDEKHSKQIYKTFFEKNVAYWTDLSTQDVIQFYDAWFFEFSQEELFKNIPKESKSLNEIGQPSNAYGVARDFLYDVNGQQGEKYSFFESKYLYETQTLPQILSGPSNVENGEVLYKLREDFWITAKQAKDYTFLIGDMDVRPMYTFIDEQDISSPDGLVLSQTEAEARQKMFDYESAILLNRYFAYDVFGNSVSSGESAADAILKMQNSVALTSKYINKKEIESWHGQPRAYNDIVQDGVYTVYSANIPNAQGGKVHFWSQESAIHAVSAGITSTIIKSDEQTIVYMYIYVAQDKEPQIYLFKNDGEIKAIVNDILSH